MSKDEGPDRYTSKYMPPWHGWRLVAVRGAYTLGYVLLLSPADGWMAKINGFRVEYTWIL